ncbi:MAG: Fic family protein [Bacteroidota bacterium]
MDFLPKIDQLQQAIADHGPWDDGVRRKVEHKLRLDWNYHSQSIEGGTLTKKETRTIMAGMVNVEADKPLKDVLEMQKHDELIQEIMQIGKNEMRLSEKRIRQIHQAIMYETVPERQKQIGNWKTEANEIINYRGEKFVFTHPSEVPVKIHELLNQTNANWDKLSIQKRSKEVKHPVLMAFDFHLEYLTIHPFYDGNGRTARILLNLILIAFGYPPLIVKTDDKDAYYRYLSEIQGYGATKDLYYAFMGGLLIRSQELILSALKGEEIEEVGDLIKHIELFQKEQQARANGLEPIKYSEVVFQHVYQHILLPFYEEVREKTKVFDPSFNAREEKIYTDVLIENSGGTKYREELFIALSLNEKVHIENLHPQPYKFNLDILWKEYRYNPVSPFSMGVEVYVSFENYNLSVKRSVGEKIHVILEDSYAQLMLGRKHLAHEVKPTIAQIFEDQKRRIANA